MDKYSWEKFRDHYVVIESITGAIIAHCDNPVECREEIEELNRVSSY